MLKENELGLEDVLDSVDMKILTIKLMSDAILEYECDSSRISAIISECVNLLEYDLEEVRKFIEFDRCNKVLES